MSKLTKRKLYCVWWIDTFNQLRWRDFDEIEDLAKKSADYIRTVGYYVGTYGQFVCFAASYNTNPAMSEWGCITFIPKGTIKDIKLLR